MKMDQKTVYTIGYSGYENNTDLFLDELKKRNISVLIDVRSDPYSAHFDNFNKEPFSKKLETNNILYRNYCNEFGAKQLDRSCYSRFDGEKNRIDYQLFTQTERFKDGVNKLKKMHDLGYIPAIMCSEKDPINCHRAIMIANSLSNEYSMTVFHIVPDKKDESQKELEERLKTTISSELEKKKKMNILELKMKDELFSLFSDKKYSNDIQNFYRIMNSRIGWEYNSVLGYK